MMRLSRYLARAGASSRRGSERLILDGRVSVNGQVVRELGTKVDEDSDCVSLDGKQIFIDDSAFTIMLNKPTGYVTTMHDPQGRPTVAELVPISAHPALFPVGRLDFNTTGLLLFTTDGDMGNALLHPSRNVEKTYIARISGNLSDAGVSLLREGVLLDDGMTAPAKVEVLQAGKNPLVSISIHEGRKRQVRRMFSAIGCHVEELHRLSFGSLCLDDLQEGCWRELTDAEVHTLLNNAR
ncbi:pseudouridine synthase [Adlercreutzia sp. ZJ304]|uniref:pseudouridine synthase n=1 Tax=Adlercreutzia sp. ZJ304 TaxID=2709791 RepID=UPI0013EB36C6|nr:pseudouridine synthase [Adlercreutzia sp. ZJ304]